MPDTVNLPGGLAIERTFVPNPFLAGLAKQAVPNSTGGGGRTVPEKKNVIQAATEAVAEVVKPKKRGPKPKTDSQS